MAHDAQRVIIFPEAAKLRKRLSHKRRWRETRRARQQSSDDRPVFELGEELVDENKPWWPLHHGLVIFKREELQVFGVSEFSRVRAK